MTLSENDIVKMLLEYIGKNIDPKILAEKGTASTPAIPISDTLPMTEYAITLTLTKALRTRIFAFDELNENF